jgi:hypothetical protein
MPRIVRQTFQAFSGRTGDSQKRLRDPPNAVRVLGRGMLDRRASRCGIGSRGGRCLSLEGHVTGTGATRGAPAAGGG